MLSDSTDGIESAFAGNSIFLVAKLLLQKLNYSVAFVSCPVLLRIITVRKRSESENSSHERWQKLTLWERRPPQCHH